MLSPSSTQGCKLFQHYQHRYCLVTHYNWHCKKIIIWICLSNELNVEYLCSEVLTHGNLCVWFTSLVLWWNIAWNVWVNRQVIKEMISIIMYNNAGFIHYRREILPSKISLIKITLQQVWKGHWNVLQRNYADKSIALTSDQK